MNGLNRILERIASEANAEKQRILSNAAEAADKIHRESENYEKELCSISEKNTEKEAALIIDRAKSTGEAKRKQLILKKKTEITDRLYRDVKESLLSLPKEKYSRFLSGLIAAAADKLPAKEDNCCTTFSVIFNERDRKLFSADAVKGALLILKRDISVETSQETANISGGVIVSCGDIQINCSMEAIISSVRNTTEAETVKLIFDEDDFMQVHN